MKIAILGWGSLIWEPKELKGHIADWEPDGPELKIEFSRISDSRDGALTLVIDDDNGTATKVAWCLSTRKELPKARKDLKDREGTKTDDIHFVVVADAAEATDSPHKQIVAWAKAKGIDAVLWTALESNFEEKTDTPFSVTAAVAHLKGLKEAGQARAKEYISKAPDFVQTELRAALKDEPGYTKNTTPK